MQCCDLVLRCYKPAFVILSANLSSIEDCGHFLVIFVCETNAWHGPIEECAVVEVVKLASRFRVLCTDIETIIFTNDTDRQPHTCSGLVHDCVCMLCTQPIQ